MDLFSLLMERLFRSVLHLHIYMMRLEIIGFLALDQLSNPFDKKMQLRKSNQILEP
jgi:hypothetical protein